MCCIRLPPQRLFIFDNRCKMPLLPISGIMPWRCAGKCRSLPLSCKCCRHCVAKRMFPKHPLIWTSCWQMWIDVRLTAIVMRQMPAVLQISWIKQLNYIGKQPHSCPITAMRQNSLSDVPKKREMPKQPSAIRKALKPLNMAPIGRRTLHFQIVWRPDRFIKMLKPWWRKLKKTVQLRWPSCHQTPCPGILLNQKIFAKQLSHRSERQRTRFYLFLVLTSFSQSLLKTKFPAGCSLTRL